MKHFKIEIRNVEYRNQNVSSNLV